MTGIIEPQLYEDPPAGYEDLLYEAWRERQLDRLMEKQAQEK
jgi:hypothetical protein